MYHYGDYGSGDDIFSLLYLLFWLVLVLMGALITVHYLRRDFGGGKKKKDPKK
jgi:hypothetical protein